MVSWEEVGKLGEVMIGSRRRTPSGGTGEHDGLIDAKEKEEEEGGGEE